MKGASMDIIEAISARISCRAFTTQPIEANIAAALQAEIDVINAESGLHFQLYGPREDGTAIDMSTKMFAGNPPMYAALVAQDDPIEEERQGFYGERFVLAATQFGLGTCWVASTYDHTTVRVELAEGEVLHDVVPIGFAPAKTPRKQQAIRAALRARSKKPADLWRGSVPLAQEPAWVQACMDAVAKAPSAINGQPVAFVQDDANGAIRAELIRTRTRMEYTDLGIAKYHFQAVAAEHGIQGQWEWGSGGSFVVD